MPNVPNIDSDCYNIGVEKDVSILKRLVIKDFKLKYRRSVLGVVWSVLNPLLMMIVMSAVFSFFLRYAEIPHYPLYLILGNIIFSLMNDATNNAMMSIIQASSLLKKVKVNRAVFPIQKVLFALVNFAFSLIAVVIVMLFLQVMPTWHILLLPIGVLLLIGFCIGIGLALSALSVFFRDVIHLWSVLITAWTYATPIFWPVSMMDAVSPLMKEIMLANPMYAYIRFARDCCLYQQVPDIKIWLSCIVWCLVSLLVGFLIFRKNEHKFILYI